MHGRPLHSPSNMFTQHFCRVISPWHFLGSWSFVQIANAFLESRESVYSKISIPLPFLLFLFFLKRPWFCINLVLLRIQYQASCPWRLCWPVLALVWHSRRLLYTLKGQKFSLPLWTNIDHQIFGCLTRGRRIKTYQKIDRNWSIQRINQCRHISAFRVFNTGQSKRQNKLPWGVSIRNWRDLLYHQPQSSEGVFPPRWFRMTFR